MRHLWFCRVGIREPKIQYPPNPDWVHQTFDEFVPYWYPVKKVFTQVPEKQASCYVFGPKEFDIVNNIVVTIASLCAAIVNQSWPASFLRCEDEFNHVPSQQRAFKASRSELPGISYCLLVHFLDLIQKKKKKKCHRSGIWCGRTMIFFFDFPSIW